MNPIKVDVTELRDKVATNRTAHRAIFEEAVEGYKKRSLAILEEHIAEVKSGRMTRIAVSLPYPEDHTADYDRVLAMLDMSLENSIEIDETTFSSYVMDDWQWKRQFLTSNSAYSATAARALQ